MRFTFALAITALPLFVTAIPQRVKQGGTAIPLSKRSSPVNSDKSFNLEAFKSHVASTRAKILRGFDSFEKNTGASHPSAVKRAQKRASGGFNASHPSAVKRAQKRASGGLFLDPFDIDQNSDIDIWFGTISIGTPPLTYTVLFDTGASDLVLPGVDCDASCDGHVTYGPAFSSTSVNLSKPFAIEYRNGDTVFGQQHTDNVTIVGLTATGQTIGVASHYSEGLRIDRFPADGLLGMASQSLSEHNQSPFFQTLVTQGQTDESVFAFGFTAPGPELYLGGTNPNMYSGDFTYAQVTEVGYWEVNMNAVVGNGQILLRDVTCIIDTGSSLIHGHLEDVDVFYEAVGVPCSDIPSVSFIFGDTSFPIPTETFNKGFDPDDPYYCVGAIVASDDVPHWVVGTAFLNNVYTVFDVGQLRVGFARLA
ncbi:acid protease [Gyrodon lividus]|nr:acid protease [Gyrodon lividus]